MVGFARDGGWFVSFYAEKKFTLLRDTSGESFRRLKSITFTYDKWLMAFLLPSTRLFKEGKAQFEKQAHSVSLLWVKSG